jgi:hypothetical protein
MLWRRQSFKRLCLKDRLRSGAAKPGSLSGKEASAKVRTQWHL